MGTTFTVGYSTSKKLRNLAVIGEERDAISRLENFKGDEGDLRRAAEIFVRSGDQAAAEAVLAIL